MPIRSSSSKAALKRRPLLLLSLLAICCSLLLMASPFAMAWGQNPKLPIADLNLEQINRWLDLQDPDSDIETAVLRLDGRRLFVITAPQVEDDVSINTAPVDQRVAEIETRLDQFIRNDFDPDSLEVTYQIQNGLPVISANGQVLLTITTEDAAIYGVDLETRAEVVTAQLKAALIRAHQERQPDFLQRQVHIAFITLISLCIISYLTFLMQRWVQKRRRRLAKEAKARVTESLTIDGSELVPPVAIKTALKHSSKHKWQKLHGLQQEVLRVGQAVLWLGGVLFILGLFPQTRWLQVFLTNAIRLPRVDINVPIAYTANLMKAMQLMDTVAWEMHRDAEW
jgi:hypothetical protein